MEEPPRNNIYRDQAPAARATRRAIDDQWDDHDRLQRGLSVPDKVFRFLWIVLLCFALAIIAAVSGLLGE